MLDIVISIVGKKSTRGATIDDKENNMASVAFQCISVNFNRELSRVSVGTMNWVLVLTCLHPLLARILLPWQEFVPRSVFLPPFPKR